MTDWYRVDCTEAEMVALVKIGRANGKVLHASFGGGSIVGSPDNAWAVDALIELRKGNTP